MADEEAEGIGGISVSIGASHAALPGELAQAEALFQSFRQKMTKLMQVPVGATAAMSAAAPARPAAAARPAPAAVVPSTPRVAPAATTAIRVARERAMDPRAVALYNEALAKTGERYNEVTGEAEKLTAVTTKGARTQRAAIVGVQEVAAKPVALNIDTDTSAEDAQAKFSAAREAISAPITVVVVTAEAQEQISAFGALAQGVRAQIEKPIVTTVVRPKAPVAATAAIEKEGAALAGVRAEVTDLGVGFSEAQASALNLLNTLREIVATSTKLATMPAPKAVTGGGGKRPKGRPAAASGDDEDKVPTNIQYVDQVERQRRRAAGAGLNSIDINRSEQALARQRQREEAEAERQRQQEDRLVAAASRPTRVQRVATASAETQRLTDEANKARAEQEALMGEQGRGSSFAPPLTQKRQAEIERERQAVSARAARAKTEEERQRFQTRVDEQAAQANQVRQRYVPPKSLGGDEQRTAQAFAESARVRQFRVDEQQQERLIASRRASITGAGRTSRTLASGLGALFGGTQGAQIEAQVQASQAARQLASAERAIAPLDNRLREVARSWSQATGPARALNRETFLAIRRSDEYKVALGSVRSAVEQDADAQDRLNKISSGGNVLRNLAAITAGGAAFSIGMTVVTKVLDEVAKGFNEFFEIQTGFGATSTRVTSALGAQTLALHGNADAALAAAEAQAGISAASSDALNTQLKLTTQIKAGAQAQQQASELFRAGFGVGNAPSGLFGSYGGVGGTGLLGQKGFSQQVQTDISAFQQPRKGVDLLSSFSTGLDYVFNHDMRKAIDGLSVANGGQPLLPGSNGGSFSRIGVSQEDQDAFYNKASGFQQAQMTPQGDAYLNNLNDAAKRGAGALGETAVASYRVARSQTEVDTATRAAAAAGDVFGVTLAQVQGVVLTFGDEVVGAGKDAAEAGDAWKRATEQAAVGAGIADPAQVGRANLAAEQQRQKESAASLDAIRSQQQFSMPSIIGLAQRQTQYATQVQQPTQFALGALANPDLKPGTGIAPSDQRKVAGTLKEANALQDQLNVKYKQGEQIIADTYRPAIVTNFGAAAASAFDAALSAVKTTGAEIAKVQSGLSNEQAAYQVAQYNFQLQIAKRSLADIGGLTGHNFGAGESYLGTLERQNLALSRQGQQLQFNMSQRQINFQVARAGFEAPGVTPEERQANVKEAQIEAKYAQDQLDIQKKMFGNQVKIVDIGNLRQGRDLMRQIGLLQQGRQVTIDTAAAEQKLIRLNKLQSRNVAEVTTYLSAVDNLAATAMGQIQQMEAAAGKAMAGVATSILGQFGIFFAGINQIMGGGSRGGGNQSANNGSGAGSGPGGPPPEPEGGRWANIDPRTGMPYTHPHASGGAYNLGSPIRIGANGVAGEAGDETLVILSHPRSASSGTSGSGAVVIQFNGDIHVRSENDLEQIARKVEQSLGRTLSLKGFRSGGG